MFVPSYSFTLTEYDDARPWIVRGQARREVELEPGVNFFAWAAEAWPAPHWGVQLDPWQLPPAVTCSG